MSVLFRWSLFGFLFLSSSQILAFTDPYPKNPNIDAINYKFELKLSDDTDVINGKATVKIRYLKDGEGELRLDLIKKSQVLNGKGMTVQSVSSEGKPLLFKHENDAITIQLPGVTKKGQVSTYEISYHGIPATGLKIGPNKHGDRTFFSDNWPNKGRNWLPTIDHPYDKATCEFVVTAPSHYQVVSNGLRLT